MDERPVVWCLVGYEWECGRDKGCRVMNALFTADEALALGQLGWTVMIDRQAMEDQARWDKQHETPRRVFSAW